MTAMPQQMHDTAILREHQDGEARVVAESRTPCDHCGEPAMMLVRADAARCRSFRCESCGTALIASFAERNVSVSAEILRSTKRSAKAAFVVDALMRRPFSVEQADLLNDEHEDFPIHRPRLVTSAKTTECGACQCQCLGAKPCQISDASSDHDAALFCAGCLKDCPTCGESVCYDHFDEKAKTCKACENTRYVESGEARDDYRRYGRES